jgi:aldose 1-epimerase
MKNNFLTLLAVVMMATVSCNKKTNQTDNAVAADSTKETSVSNIVKENFGKLGDGTPVFRYTLKNANGIEMQVMNYGGIITSLKTPDKNGVKEDIVLGYDSLSDYLKASPYFGALIGRYGNRIANGKFTLDGKVYDGLAKNNNGQTLHGGVKGFDKVFWNIEEMESADGPALKLTYLSKDGEEGFPGNLNVEVHYTLTNNDELKIDYRATTDKKTVVNLTQHTYFNLTGNAKTDILNHQLYLKADEYLPVDKVLIPTGKLEMVKGSPFDFNVATAIGARINEKHPQLKNGFDGYDHCWVLSSKDSVKLVGSLYEPVSGRMVETYTTEPGVQFYSGNFLDGKLTGKGGVVYKRNYGLCLETQHYPDSPNKEAFPSTVLEPGAVYQTHTTYRFTAK